MRTVLTKALHDQRRGLIGWGIGILGLVLLEAALWPTVRDMPDLTQFLANYPEPMRKLFDLDTFGTGAGFLNGELFGSMLPMLLIFYGVARGARSVAGEEESGTLEILLLTPVTMGRLIVQQAAALFAGLVALGALIFVSVLLSSMLFAMGVGVGDLAAATLSIVLLGFEFGCLALAVSALTGRRAVAIGAGTAGAVAAYAWYVAGQMVDAVHSWQWLSPFAQAVGGGPLGAGLQLSDLSMLLVGLLLLALAAPVADRRDLAVAH